MHCDVRIFEWLFQYIHSSNGGETTTNRNAVGAKTNENNRNDSSSSGNSEGGGGGGEAWSAERERVDGAGPPPLEVMYMVEKNQMYLSFIMVCWFMWPVVYLRLTERNAHLRCL